MPSRDFKNSATAPATKYLQSANLFANNLAAFTLSAWVYITAIPLFSDAGYFPILSKGMVTVGEEEVQGPSFFIFSNADGSLQVWAERTYTGNNAGLFTLMPVGGINLNEWTHVAFTLGPDLTPHIFIDGIEAIYDPTSGFVASGTPSFDDSTTPWLVGVDIPGDALASGFVGLISDVRIYSRALSQSEIYALANFIEPSTANLEARWKMCGDATELDTSGHNQLLVNFGTTVSTNQPFAFCGAAPSIREQIYVKLEALLAAGGPTGLFVARERPRPIEKEKLPAILLFSEDDIPQTLAGKQYGAPLTERHLLLVVECRAKAAMNVTADAALDEVICWATKTIVGNEQFDGLASGVDENRTSWLSREGEIPVAAAAIHFTVKYRTARGDLTKKDPLS